MMLRKALSRVLALCLLVSMTSGCCFMRTPSGWVFQTGWSLEFQRLCGRTTCRTNPSCEPRGESCSRERVCESTRECPLRARVCEKSCEEPCGKRYGSEPDDCFNRGPVTRLLGLLGYAKCGSCGHLRGSRPEEELRDPVPPVQSKPPVKAKFHPVPTHSVFDPQPTEAPPLAKSDIPQEPKPEKPLKQAAPKDSAPTPPLPDAPKKASKKSSDDEKDGEPKPLEPQPEKTTDWNFSPPKMRMLEPDSNSASPMPPNASASSSSSRR